MIFAKTPLLTSCLLALVGLTGCVTAGYRTPSADEPHAELRIAMTDHLRILSLNDQGCIAHYQVLAEGPSFFGMKSSRSDSSVAHILRADQDAILEYVSPARGTICRFHFSFRPEAGERYRLVGSRFIDPKGRTFFGREVSAEKCGVLVMKEGAGEKLEPVPMQKLMADWTPACTRFITPEEAAKKRPPAPPF